MGIEDKIAHVITNPFTCIESPSLYVILIVCIFPENEVNRMLLFVVSLDHCEEVKIIKGHILAYLTPAQYENFSDVEETNQGCEIACISVATFGTKVEILQGIPLNNKIIFPGDHTSDRKVLFQDVKISVETQEKLNSLIPAFEDIMSSLSNDISYTKLIEMDIETAPILPPIAFKPYALPLKHQKWVRKELKDLEIVGVIQISLSPMPYLL